MWAQFFDWVKTLFNQSQEITRLQNEVVELREALNGQGQQMERIVFELQRERDARLHEAIHRDDEQEKLLLRLENEMLKFERRLPPPRNERDA